MSNQSQGVIQRAWATWLAFVRVFVAWFLFRKVRRHLGGFRHVARLVDRQPMIIVPNHLSYYDGHLLNFFFWSLLGRRVTTVTNVKAFKGFFQRTYHELAGDLAVDPGDPEGTYARIGAALRRGEVLVMYPEGHRSDGAHLLPFRHGAFNLSVQHNVPILPVALRDTQRVLPKHALVYRRGELARVAFGEVLEPARFAEHDDSRVQAQRMLEHTRSVLEDLVFRPECELFSVEERQKEAAELAVVARDALERLLDHGAETISVLAALRVLRITDLGYLLEVPCAALAAQRLRAIGFLVGALPRVIAIFFLSWFRRNIERVLAADPGEPYANYVAGQFHLAVPRWFGGDVRRAVEAMRTAYTNAPDRGLSSNRYAIGYALALSRANDKGHAIALLERHFASGPEAPTERLVRRWQRARTVLDELRRTPLGVRSH